MLNKVNVNTTCNVSCYFNLHKQVFSVKQGRNPVEHFNWLLLRNCSFLVRESGRQRVLMEKRKGVHAFVKGIFDCGNRILENDFSLIQDLLPNLTEDIRIRYNPYLYGYFFEAKSLKPIYNCDICLLINKSIYRIR